MPKAVLLIASRTVELQDLQGGKDVHPFHHAMPLTSIFQELEVKPLSIEAGAQILIRGSRSVGSEHDVKATALAKQCECIPQRLRLAAGILSSGQASFEVSMVHMESSSFLLPCLLVIIGDSRDISGR